MERIEAFSEYLERARWDFAKVADKYSIEKHLELRTAIDSFLIAYDQAVYKALNLANVSGQSELLLDFVRWQNRCSKWVTIPENMVDDYLAWKKSSNSH